MKKIGTHFLFLLLAGNAVFAQNLTVHEWGTFTTLHSSEGASLSGLYVEEEQLPPFVYHFPGFSPDPVRTECSNVTVKMETPVLYFYSPSQRSVKVHVDFPNGAITQWYPQRSGGEVIPTGNSLDFANPDRVGSIEWDATILDPKSTAPFTGVNASLKWTDPRNTDANRVQNNDGETEKFLFYRGVANFSLPVDVKFLPNGDLQVTNESTDDIPFIYIYDYTDQTANIIRVWGAGPLAGHETKQFVRPNEKYYNEEDCPQYKLFQPALVAAGLTNMEASAMLKTWTDGYFQTRGFKIFWIVPRPLTDGILPISISPTPNALERVLVGKTEILTPELEARLLTDYKSGEATFDYNWAYHHYFHAYKQRAIQLASSASVSVPTKTDNLLLSPNPATNLVTINASVTTKEDLFVSVRNILGESVLSMNLHNEKTLDVHTLTAGIYLVSISDGTQHWTTKLIKQ